MPELPRCAVCGEEASSGRNGKVRFPFQHKWGPTSHGFCRMDRRRLGLHFLWRMSYWWLEAQYPRRAVRLQSTVFRAMDRLHDRFDY